MTPTATTSTPVLIPAADQLRKRLVAVITEADVLRRQLRVSARNELEHERIRLLTAEPEGVPNG